ncbi:Activator of Hsp90 ATPase 1 family protein [Paenibacillus curdlanolyticus YK9]|uniref:Activator of Hsp90 ATPase 1 family protein n=1 Tax=Paenibacillus curdlanolyticus YK9 TaxID=717606 RepID=E0I5S5_9BACL|nr:SRPBCC domain-containing protein [Paenibacillus curdlanolyticus]EFM12317.1 Activator of Hsp90 ATPase 1 family protein [Paenibacillus curdlanolyticus YK9]
MDNNLSQSFEISITRVFNAPRELVFKAWTELDHFAQWWGPKGVTLQIFKMDARSGGEFLGIQTSPDGNQVMWTKFAYQFAYQEVVEPERVAYIRSFSDEQGNTVRSPFSVSWPLEIMNSISLEDDEGKTVLKLKGCPVNALAEEQEAYRGMAPRLLQDLESIFNRLADYLAFLN